MGVKEKLVLSAINDLISTHVEDESILPKIEDQTLEDDSLVQACYMLPVKTERGETTTYYMCTDRPEDNDNLRCEETSDGMDWLCVARIDPHDGHLSNYNYGV